MRKYFVPFLCALPGILIGTLIMYTNGISLSIYIQNLICLVIGGILSTIYMSKEYNIIPKNISVMAVLNVLFLGSTFLFDGIDGVHRWFSIGRINLNVAFISLPILLIVINKFLQNGYMKKSYILILAVAIVLFLQPDASMISAFSAALIPAFYINQNKKGLKYILVTLTILSIISWINIDNLEPVSYVEGIIVLAQNSGWLYLVGCVLSVLVMLLPFVKRDNCGQRKVISRSLGLFFFVLILSAILGNFPVPLIGYGSSPIIGYLISVSYMEKRDFTA